MPMAEAVVSVLVGDVLGKLACNSFQEYRRLRRLEDDVSALRDTYTMIQAVLADAEVKQRDQKAVEEWLNRLRSASLEVENFLDDVLVDNKIQMLHKEIENRVKYKVKAFLSSDHNPLVLRVKVANEVKAIRTKLDMIAKDISHFNFNSNTVSVDVRFGSETTHIRETTSLVPLFKIYGRDEEVTTVVDKICSGDDIQGFRVYAIWGMGGVGKTTLAQLVYNHERVKSHFELQSWVYVSSEFQVKKITKEIIESIKKKKCELSQLDSMQKELQENLERKRFLIVLDDVWIEDRDVKKWDELSKALSSAAKGSIVMITTRNQTTSRMISKVYEFQHKVGCLSEEESWSLFKNLAFTSRSGRMEGNTSELQSMGKEIVRKCQGLPLAVRTLGGIMWSKRSASEWQRVKDSDVWNLPENDTLPALKLSYDNLLPHMKRCFAYCCLFTKGYEMRRNVLIELSMANDFIPPREQATLYEIGEQIFNFLVSRSFLQDVQKSCDYLYDGELVCKMHDLMYDLAQNVMKQDFYVIVPGKTLITPGKGEVLHFSSTCSEFSFSGQDLERLRSLRSIVMFSDRYKSDIISQISNHLYLRILILNGIDESRLPESICKLKHLRYLSISRSFIETLPESIVYLCNLQVLNVQRCHKLRKLPEGMRYMKNLQCLYIKGCEDLKCMPVGIKELSCLRRLEEFKVGIKEGAQIKELGNLNLLGEKLELRGLENVGGLEDAKSAYMKDKTNLLSLGLYWNGSRSEIGEFDEEVLEGLEPNSSLKELKLHNYMGRTISPSWMMKLGSLVKIVFDGCERCESIPSLGKLPSLRVIKLWRMEVLKCLDDNEFPSLQELDICTCNQLVCLPSNLSKLSELRIVSCPELHCLPSNLSKLSELSIGSFSGLHCLPSNLSKLSKLCIVSCPVLHCLPDGLKELTSLRIWDCENLRRRCEKEKGEDWHKISHVPILDLRG